MGNARHSKAGRFVQQRLFCDLSDFAQLETRIAALPDEKARGDAFEVFAEAYQSASVVGAAMQSGGANRCCQNQFGLDERGKGRFESGMKVKP
jgi:hypothetical protein